jgi:hypothetical protein
MDVQCPAALAVRADALDMLEQRLFFVRALEDRYLGLHVEPLRSSPPALPRGLFPILSFLREVKLRIG